MSKYLCAALFAIVTLSALTGCTTASQPGSMNWYEEQQMRLPPTG